MDRGYNKKLIGKQILRAQEHCRNDLLERKKVTNARAKISIQIYLLFSFSKC